MRLRIVHTCHFGKSELNNFLEVLAKHPELGAEKSKYKLAADDVVLLVSKMGDQLVFVHGFDNFTHADKDWRVLRTRRLRIGKGGRWNPLMLADYAKRINIPLHGLTLFEEHIKKLLDLKGRS